MLYGRDFNYRTIALTLRKKMLKRQDTHIVAVHQPNFFPWFGYFVKIALSDTFILLDDVQIPWRGYTRRTKIRRPGNDGLLEWCPVIIPSGYTYAGINKIPLDDRRQWQGELSGRLESRYRSGAGFKELFPRVQTWLNNRATNLATYNTAIIRNIMDLMDIRKELNVSSDYPVSSSGSARIVELMQYFGGNVYLSGRGGNKYHRENDFIEAGIKIIEVPNLLESPLLMEVEGINPEASILEWLFMLGIDRTREFFYKYLDTIVIG